MFYWREQNRPPGPNTVKLSMIEDGNLCDCKDNGIYLY